MRCTGRWWSVGRGAGTIEAPIPVLAEAAEDEAEAEEEEGAEEEEEEEGATRGGIIRTSVRPRIPPRRNGPSTGSVGGCRTYCIGENSP